jgi:hypothetical protein
MAFVFRRVKRPKLPLLLVLLVGLLILVTLGILGYRHLNAPKPVTVFDKALTQPGYTLVAPTKSHEVYLVDNDGRTVHTWKTDHNPGLETSLLPDGRLLRTYDVGNKSFDKGGQGGGIQIINWDGSVAWDYRYSSDRTLLHHDALMMPDGHILTSAWVKISKADAVAAGVNPKNVDSKSSVTWSNDILEIDPATNKVVWQWNAFDHLVQDYDASKPNYGAISQNPRRIDANYYTYAAKPDWLHVNAVAYDAATDQIMISAREFNELWVIDHSTTTAQAASSTGGQSDHGGDLLYRYGNPEAYGHGTPQDRVLYLQHDIHWIGSGLPGAGDVLLFNNGQAKTPQPYSTVLELALPVQKDGSYPLDPTSGAFASAKLVWQYQPTTEPDKFFSKFMGSAQRLPNGNTLVADAMHGRAFEVKPDGTIVWDYTNPRQALTIFRAYKYAPDNPAVASL